VFEDSSGKIWFSDDNELFRISGNSVTSMLKGTAYSDAHQIENRLYFVSANHIIAFDLHKQTFLSPVPIPEGPTTHLYSCLLNNGLILIATKNTVYAFDSHTMHISSAEHFFEGKKLQSARFISDNKGNVWLYNASGVLWKHDEDNTFKPLRLISSEILAISQRERYHIYHDSHDIIWISTFGNGLFAFDSDGKQISHFTAGKDLPTDYLFCVIEDTSGEIWVGTELAGVTKISLTNYPFDIFYPNSDSDRDRDNAVRLIYEDSKGRYWFGTRDGYLHVCDSLLHPIHKHRIAGGIPFSITEDSQGNKWVGTKGAGLLVFDADGKHKLQTYRLNDGEKQVSSSNNIFTIMNDTKGRMWIASFGGGLHLVEKLTENDVRFRQIRMKNSQQNMMRSMIQDADGMIWVGTNDGLVIFDPDAIIKDEANYITLNPNTQNWQSPNSNEVRVVFEDSRKRIWIGTTGGGLNLLVREKPLSNSRFKHYGVENGLSNEMIQAIQEDGNGHIWISTENGISKFDFQTELFENFSFSSSRNTTVFSELSCWKKKNGKLMFGSYNGVYIFAPAGITYDTYSPPVVITGLRINGSVASAGDPNSPLTESITSTKTIFLKYNQNSFNLEYTMLNFHAPEYNQYIYYLEGYETDWNSISRSNIATYRNLPPGNYHFKVKGCNSFGIWNNLVTDLQIVISPPWWKSGWAWFAYFIVASILVYFASKLILKIYQLNTTVKMEKQLTEYKLRFFTNISHEFRTPLTIIRGSIENLSAQKDLPSAVSKQINTLAKSSARLLRLVEQLLEFRRLQNDKMELILEHIEACDFFRDIWQTFRDMADKKGIEYIFECNVM
jgi:ligand-binding sensor domain-containing protein